MLGVGDVAAFLVDVHGLGFVICNENKIILKTKIRFRTNLKLELTKNLGLEHRIVKFESCFLEDLLYFLLSQKEMHIRKQPHTKLGRRLVNPCHQATSRHEILVRLALQGVCLNSEN